MMPGQMSAMRAQALRMPMQPPSPVGAPMPQQQSAMPGVGKFGGGMPPMPGRMPMPPVPFNPQPGSY